MSVSLRLNVTKWRWRASGILRDIFVSHYGPLIVSSLEVVEIWACETPPPSAKEFPFLVASEKTLMTSITRKVGFGF